MNMDDESIMAKGSFERIASENSFLTHKVNGEKFKYEHRAKNHEEAINFVLEQLMDKEHGVISSLDDIHAIGHRMVHGGEKFKSSVLITEDVIRAVEECIPLAPIHNPAGLSGIKACMKSMPGKPMVAVFDTAFHQTIPKERYLYPIPYEYYEKYGVRKYGFHGTSHRYVSKRIAKLLNKDVEDLKIISCHLGQGASICAIQNGKSADTSMGLTPVAGIAMGTRSGDLDPSIVTFIMEKENLTPEQMNTILNKKSGLLALSGISEDNRDIEDAASQGNERAISALEEYAYIIAQYIGRYVATMNGVDVITFEGGVGERGPLTREQVCNYLGYLGLE